MINMIVMMMMTMMLLLLIIMLRFMMLMPRWSSMTSSDLCVSRPLTEATTARIL